MHKKQRRRLAFTLAEIIVVVTIVIILAGIAFSSTSGVIKNLRFNNAFNKMVLMVQEARNLAATGKDSRASNYGIDFYQMTQGGVTVHAMRLYKEFLNAPQQFIFNSTQQPDLQPPEDQELLTYHLPQTLSLLVTPLITVPAGSAVACNPSSNPPPSLFFNAGSGSLEIRCGNNPATVQMYSASFTIAETPPGGPQAQRSKAFTIHKAAGIPQIQ